MTNVGDGSAHLEMFKILKSTTLGQGARLGSLRLPGRNVLETPHYIGLASRGVIPHLSPDNVMKKTDLKGLYIPLEDFIEKASNNKQPPILSERSISSPSPLRDFISASNDPLLVLGARRTPPVTSPWSNSLSTISIYTSVGFGQLKAIDYAAAALKLKPDILIGAGDIPDGEKPGVRRMDKMSSRTERYMKDIIDEMLSDTGSHRPPLFAPILPIPHEAQSYYIELLSEDWLGSISGLAIYDVDNVLDLPEVLVSLPRLSFSAPPNPLAILREVSLGNDLFTIPFIGACTDAGIALDFHFPAQNTSSRRELGVDMWSDEHSTSLVPLVEGCDCYACQKHHRAYLQHLLSAKEMLAWTLLQMHNLRIMDAFFAGVRQSVAKGTFEEDVESFRAAYQVDLPEKTGHGPRVRGYQYKSEGPDEARRNPPAFTVMNGGPVQD